MTWLKTFGLEVLKVINVVVGILDGGSIQKAFPGAAGTVTVVQSDLKEIGTVITDIETAFAGASAGATAAGVTGLPAKTGVIKLAAATPLVSQKILASPLMTGQKIKNEALYASAVKSLTSSVADLLNSLDPSTVKATKV